MKNFFFGPKLQGRCGSKFSGIICGRSYTVPIAFCQGGIETLRLSFGAGSPGNWDFHGPPNLGQILDTFQMPPKNWGGGRGKFSPWGNTYPWGPWRMTAIPHPHFPPKNFRGGLNLKNLTPNSPKNWSSDFDRTFPIGGGLRSLASLKVMLQKKHFCSNCGHLCFFTPP